MLHLYHFHPPPIPNTSRHTGRVLPTSSQVLPLLFNYCYTHICICKYSLLSPFNAAHMCIWQGCWRMDNLLGSSSLEKNGSPSLNNHWSSSALHAGEGTCAISHPYVALSSSVVIVLCRWPYCWDFVGAAFLSYTEDANSQQACCSSAVLYCLFRSGTRTLGEWLCCRWISWSWASPGRLFSAIWPLADFCKGLCLLKKGTSLMRSESGPCLGEGG